MSLQELVERLQELLEEKGNQLLFDNSGYFLIKDVILTQETFEGENAGLRIELDVY